jgi:hypothetical protein
MMRIIPASEVIAMRKATLVKLPLALTLLSLGIAGQDPAPSKKPAPPAREAPASPCPKFDIQNPPGRVIREGQSVVFSVNIAGGDPKVTPIIVWNLSAGYIKDGQGTRRIEVDSTGAGNDRQIVADIWLGGYATECPYQAMAAVKVIPPAYLAEEFGDLDPEKENERLANVASFLSQSKDNLYVIAYAGRNSVRGFAGNALRRIRTQLIASGFSRGGFVDGGFREEPAYELWIVPEGAEPPSARPTIDRKEIVYPKPTPKRKP